MLVDSHAHLEAIDDLERVIERAKKKAIEIAEKFSSNDLKIYATVGLHPKDANKEIERFGLLSCFKTGKQLAQSSNKVVAIGECGLDYYGGFRGQGSGTSDEEKKIQKELFVEQIKLADELDMPLVIHCRNGWKEIFNLISNAQTPNSKIKGVFHSWTGNWDDAKRALDLGFYISFSGIVTFSNAADIQEVARKMPFDRILIETDSPYLPPEPFRGSTNEPTNARIVAQFI